MLSAPEVDVLLARLCSALGFCLEPAQQLQLRANSPDGIDAFTDAVFTAEGLDPVTADAALYRQVRNYVAHAFAQSAQHQADFSIAPPIDLEFYTHMLVELLDRSGIVAHWSTIVFVDALDLRPDSRTTVASSRVRDLASFGVVFPSLVTGGLSWLNLSAWGVLDGQLVVGVEKPAGSSSARYTSVNLSGPPRFVQARPGCDLAGLLEFRD